MAPVQMSTDMWWHWARISIEAEASAISSTQKWLVSMDAEELGVSFRAALTSIVAAAFSIEALCSAVRPISSGPGNADKNWSKVKNTLTDPFSLTSVRRLDQRLRALFELRDQGAHPWDRLEESVAHPSDAGYVPVQIATYSAEEATKSVDLVLEILRACTRHPKADREPSKQWAADYSAAVQRLKAIRSDLADGRR